VFLAVWRCCALPCYCIFVVIIFDVFHHYHQVNRTLSSISAEHFVGFYGAVLEPRICIVMEYCKNGSLYHALKNENLHLDWPKVLKFAFEMTAAINCLHGLDPPIFHRDLKSLNMLLTKDFQLKLSDFGTARFQSPENQDSMSKLCGTYSYASPELFFAKPYTDKCDIFSVGICLWELVTRVIKGKYEAPYTEYPQLKMDYQIFFHVAKKNFRPTIPKNCPPLMVEAITKCWAEYPENRPTANELMVMMEKIETDYNQNAVAWESTAAITCKKHKSFKQKDVSSESPQS